MKIYSLILFLLVTNAFGSPSQIRLGSKEGWRLIAMHQIISAAKIACYKKVVVDRMRIGNHKLDNFVFAKLGESVDGYADEYSSMQITHWKKYKTDEVLIHSLPKKANLLVSALYGDLDKPESIRNIHLALTELQHLLSSEGLMLPHQIDRELSAITKKMVDFSQNWNFTPPTNAEKKQWKKLHDRLATDIVKIAVLTDGSLPVETLASIKKFYKELLEEMTISESLVAAKSLLAVEELENLAKIHFAGKNSDEGLHQKLHTAIGSDTDMFIGVTRMVAMHEDLLKQRLAGKVSATEFVQKYQKLLTDNLEFLPAGKLAEAEEILMNIP